MKDLINIAIPNFNNSLTILETIASVVNQSYHQWIINIYDNYSTDDSIKIISKKYNKLITEGRIKVHLNNNFISQAENWNRCLNDISSYRYFKLLCADDILEKNHLKTAINALYTSNNGVAGFSSAINYINHKNIITGYRSYGFYSLEFWVSLFYRNYIGCPSSVVIKSSHYKNYKYSEIPYVGDLIFNMEFYLDDKKFIFNKNPTVRFRLHEKSSTTKLFGSKIMTSGRFEFRKYIIKRLDQRFVVKYILFSVHVFIAIIEKLFFSVRNLKVLLFYRS